ncbi:MAG TPA: hypothetical protein VFI93_13880 [Rhizomicrobium sp.]|jgi:hypothetical protein|nr:hypothetical protein [Rhizomicrobium sp.]
MTKRNIALLAGAALCWPMMAQAGQLVVVEARGVALAQGATLDSDKPINLKAGQHLTLIAADGTTLQLDGPFDKAPSSSTAKGAGLSAKLAALGAGGQRFSEVGTTRRTAIVKLPSPWLLDISHSGAVCMRDSDANPVMWRPASIKPANITIMPDDRSWRATLRWPANRAQMAATSDVPLHSGNTYYVSAGGERHAISIYPVPESLSNARMQAAWLAQKGCEAQAEALLRTVK